MIKNSLLAIYLLSISSQLDAKDTLPIEISWSDLIPEGYKVQTFSVDHSFTLDQIDPNAPVVETLNGKTIKIPGFVVPLELTREGISEFLLVPYFGACLHEPPPPSNQIIYVKPLEAVTIENLHKPLWVFGQIDITAWSGHIASVGYRINNATLEAFKN